MKTIHVRLLPKQEEFIRSAARFVLYSGAFGAGKTRGLCYKLLSRVAGRPGARELLARKVNVSLIRTTLHTLLNPDGDMPPVLPPGSYEHNISKQTINVHGGGEIVYCGFDDLNKIKSLQLTGAGLDEVTEFTEADWTMLRGRIRVKCGDLPNQLYAATNPDTPSHFLARLFGFAPGVEPEAGYHPIQTCTLDNPYLPDAYIADLKTLKGVAYNRFVLGLWVGSDILVYDTWDRNVFVQKRREAWRRVLVGVDEGYANPGVMLVVCEDGDGRIHIPEEVYSRRQLEKWWLGEAHRLTQLYDIESFIVDPSAAKYIAAMQNLGYDALKADNDRKAGVRNVRGRLVVRDDDRPRFTVDPGCSNLIREFETYENKVGPDGEPTDEPGKENDHAMDALRYACMAFNGGSFEREPGYGMH